MIIDSNSVFEKITDKHFSKKEIQFYDAIKHTTQMVDISYNRLMITLFQKGISSYKELAMLDCWSIVDSLYRIKCLLQNMIGIKKNLPWFQKFFRSLDKVEDLRHFIQHYNEKIIDLLESKSPLLGYVSWVVLTGENKVEVGLLYSGRIRENISLDFVNPAGKQFRANLDHIVFTIGTYNLDLSDSYFDLIEFIKNVELFVEEKLNNTI